MVQRENKPGGPTEVSRLPYKNASIALVVVIREVVQLSRFVSACESKIRLQGRQGRGVFFLKTFACIVSVPQIGRTPNNEQPLAKSGQGL